MLASSRYQRIYLSIDRSSGENPKKILDPKVRMSLVGKFASLVMFCLSLGGGHGAFATQKYTSSDLYAMQQLWGVWNQSNVNETQSNLVGWNTLLPTPANPPCSPATPWQGVFCHAKQTNGKGGLDTWIVGLRLNGANLKGGLPAAIGNLSNLVSLTLTGNPELAGPIPVELGNIYSLFELDLHGNAFSGIIPGFPASAFSFLQALDISSNNFTGELPGLDPGTYSYHTIQTLNLSRNLFTGQIPRHTVTYLYHLVSADFSFNNFIGPLPVLSWNSSTTNSNLAYLNFANNKFNGSLPMIEGYHALNYLNASNNQLIGEILPITLLNITLLKTLDLSYNGFSGYIPNLSTLKMLQHLDLSFNNFKPSPFPNWVTSLPKLQSLILRGNSLIGEIPPLLLTSFHNMTTLVLDDNNLVGALDISHLLCTQANDNGGCLQLLSIRNNNITNVVYYDRVEKLRVVTINLAGNPYCQSSARESDLKRCVCSQQCIDSGQYMGNKNIIIVSTTVVGGSLLALLILTSSFLLWKVKRDKYNLLLEVQQKFADYEVKPTIFTYNELRTATEDFKPHMKLGKGAYGTVYKGNLSNGNEVAVKQLFVQAQQNMDDFLNEVVLVAAMKHRNLVKLKGCCLRKDQRLLVYEYVESGDVAQVIFGHKRGIIESWPIRLKICLGVAHGLHYLHALAQPRIIHRDIKASNVLLDKDFNPKIADFGLALLFPDEQSHMTMTNVAGTRGYVAPEYATLGQLSEKVDVYSFGVLLFEIISGRRNIDSNLPVEKMYLLEQVFILHSEDKIMDLVDPTMSLDNEEEMQVQWVFNVALLCLHTNPDRRPTMARVVAMLQGDIEPETKVSSHRNFPFHGNINSEESLDSLSISNSHEISGRL